MNIYQKLIEIQSRLHCPKGLEVRNYSGQKQYEYRNLAGIYEAVKPLLKELGCALIVNCETVVVGEGDPVRVEETDRGGNAVGAHLERGARIYQQATATLIDGADGQTVSCKASARENEWRKGMDASQLSGSAESFASKYACEHLFALDSTADADDLAARDGAPAPSVPKNAPQRPLKDVPVPKVNTVSPKAQEAWKAYKALPAVAKLDKDARTKDWLHLLKEETGIDSASEIGDEGWDKVLNRLSIEAQL